MREIKGNPKKPEEDSKIYIANVNEGIPMVSTFFTQSNS